MIVILRINGYIYHYKQGIISVMDTSCFIEQTLLHRLCKETRSYMGMEQENQ